MNLDKWADLIEEYGDTRCYFCFTTCLKEYAFIPMEIGYMPSDIDVETSEEAGFYSGVYMVEWEDLP